MLGPEPTLIIQAVVAALIAANTAISSQANVPWWVSVAISAVIVGLGALVNRSQVRPMRHEKKRRRRRRRPEPTPTPPPSPPTV